MTIPKMPLISRIDQLSLLKSLPYSWNIKISMIDCTQNSVLQGKEYIAILHQVNFLLTILLCSILIFFFFVSAVQHLHQVFQLLLASCNTPPSLLFHLFTFLFNFYQNFNQFDYCHPFQLLLAACNTSPTQLELLRVSTLEPRQQAPTSQIPSSQ